MKIKRLNILIIGFIFVILSSSLINAFAVGFSGSKLGIYPNQNSLEESFSLQNYGEDAKDIIVEIVVEEGNEYVSFTQGISYNIPAQSNIAVPIIITPPAGAQVGDKFSFTVLFRSDSGSSSESAEEGNIIGFNINQRHVIEIEVVEKPTGESVQETPQEAEGISQIWYILGIILLIVIIAIIVLLVKRKK